VAGSIPAPAREVRRLAWRRDAAGRFATEEATRTVPEETAVAFDYDGVGYAVMMATPADLEDFATGFSLTEGVIGCPAEIEELSVVPTEDGIVLRMGLAGARRDALWERRRHLAGPSGCGLCGIESLNEALRSVPAIESALHVSAAAIAAAMASLSSLQALNRRTRAVHAAAFWQPGGEALIVREDVGRHNALDKLVGAIARGGHAAAGGVVLLTSRISVEMVQKAAVAGAPIVVAVSAPTALAVRVAERAGITLAGIARDDGFEIFTHPGRISLEPRVNVA
jgi:FdhD protein